MTIPQFLVQTNFTAGEWSPRLRGRVDLQKFPNSCQTLLNTTVLVQGGATRRTGTYYVAEVKDSSKETRIIPFVYSTTQAYVLEFGDGYMRVYRERGQVVESNKTITGITAANPAVVTSNAHGFSNGDQVYITGVAGMTQVNNRRFTVANVAANTFELSGVNSSAYTAYSSGGVANEIYTVTTPWADEDLEQLKFTQSADTLFVAHPLYQTRKITRTSDTGWTVALYEPTDGPYLDVNTTTTTFTPSAASGAITVTASTATFASTDVGRLIRIKEGGSWGWLKITGYTSSTQVNADVKGANLAATAAVTDWRLGAWSDTTGWPSVVTFFQERLVFASTTTKPQTIWGSRTNSFEDMTPTAADGTVTDTHAFTFTIADDQVNAIRWMSAGKTLLQIGTSDAEHTLYGGNSNGALVAVTPSNVTIARETTYGSAKYVRTKRIANNVVFAQPSKRKIRATLYDYKYDAYVANDITLLSEHITSSGVKDFDYQEELTPTGWFCLEDGTLIGFTYEQQQDVMAWHRHELGGDGIVEYVSVIPSPTEEEGDDLWLVVKRGSTRFIEYLHPSFDPVANGQASGFFVDAGLTYDGFLGGTVTAGATSGSGVTFTASSSVFASTMVGDKIYQFEALGDYGLRVVGKATITGYTNATTVTATITNDFTTTSAIANGLWAVAKQTISGANHLDGVSCVVCVDGASHPNVTPSFGAFTLTDHFAKVHIGYGYNSDIQLWPPENPQLGTALGMVKAIKEVNAGLLYSNGLKVGPSFNDLETIPFRSASDYMDTAVPLFTGVKRIPYPDGYAMEPSVCIRQDLPLPMTITFIEQKVTYHG